MRRYRMLLLVYEEVEQSILRTSPVKVHVTADSEMGARRLALEQAWANGLWVEQFVEVTTTA